MRYADKMGWQTQILSKTDCEAGGVSEVIISMKGDSIYSRLKYESGVHRVQRVPATESQGLSLIHIQMCIRDSFNINLFCVQKYGVNNVRS